ncbi:MAG: fumarate hydratase [Nitrospirae bacterium GWC2_57_13]|jgi:fumarate hydratase subunit alpha|nr:MAG: fumarate hydratase [Nitrospirae bacterium GWC2_57_13]
MREIHVDEIRDNVAQICIDAAYSLSEDVLAAFDRAIEEETSPSAKEILELLKENARVARVEHIPICQDTGIGVFFVEVGQDLRIKNGFLSDAINDGVRKGYRDGHLRKSVVDPLTRRNTGDNTPAIIYTEVVPGDKLRISFMPKGAGSENMSAIRMLRPTEGIEGIKAFVLDCVRRAGANPCPPVVVGVGIGGDFEKSALLAKKALLRNVGSPHPKLELASLEMDLLKAVNKTGIGPEGLGGKMTAMAVHVESFPCHIASLPVAVNINCHAARHKTIVL